MNIASLGYLGDTIADHLRTWPESKWRPGDDPPIGQRILVPSHGNNNKFFVGIVLGAAEKIEIHHCNSCACLSSTFDGWWKVQFVEDESVPAYLHGKVSLQLPYCLKEST